jgi:biopolymer transport protein ExbB
MEAEVVAAAAESPYGLIPLWNSGGWITQGLLVTMLFMSLYSWFIIFTKLWDQRTLNQSAKIVEKNFWTAPSIKDGVDRLKKGDEFRFIAEDGLRAASHHEGRLTDRIDLHEWVTMALQRSSDAVNGRLSSGLAFLATVGSTSPFIGLLGTGIGILRALLAIGLSGRRSGRRGADHDRHRSGSRGASGAGL